MSKRFFAKRLWENAGAYVVLTGIKRQYRLYVWKSKPSFNKAHFEIQLRERALYGSWVATRIFPERIHLN